jgi:hypothetical protein
MTEKIMKRLRRPAPEDTAALQAIRTYDTHLGDFDTPTTDTKRIFALMANILFGDISYTFNLLGDDACVMVLLGALRNLNVDSVKKADRDMLRICLANVLESLSEPSPACDRDVQQRRYEELLKGIRNQSKG